MRHNKILIGLMYRLCNELEQLTELFFKERPFLFEKTNNPTVLDFNKERIELQINVDSILKEVSKI